jgi:hypothetical protein
VQRTLSTWHFLGSPPRLTPAATIAILRRISVRDARHDSGVAVAVGGLLLRSIDHPVGAIGSSEVHL